MGSNPTFSYFPCDFWKDGWMKRSWIWSLQSKDEQRGTKKGETQMRRMGIVICNWCELISNPILLWLGEVVSNPNIIRSHVLAKSFLLCSCSPHLCSLLSIQVFGHVADVEPFLFLGREMGCWHMLLASAKLQLSVFLIPNYNQLF